MTDNHPTPPPELVELWHNEAMLKGFRNKGSYYGHELAIQAAHWAADQELEACCEWQDTFNYPNASNLLRAARRPKLPSLKEQAQVELDRLSALIPTEGEMAMGVPAWSLLRAHRHPNPPSLKEQALKALTKIEDNGATYLDSSVIRRALEQLND